MRAPSSIMVRARTGVPGCFHGIGWGRYRRVLLALSVVISSVRYRGVVHLPRSRVLRAAVVGFDLRAGVRRGVWGNLEPRGLGVLGGGVQGSPTVLILIFVLAWVGGVLWSWSFLTSAARRVGEVRKRKRNGQDGTHPGQRRQPLWFSAHSARIHRPGIVWCMDGSCAAFFRLRVFPVGGELVRSYAQSQCGIRLPVAVFLVMRFQWPVPVPVAR